jgi:uncharacterized protein (TIGR02996 family)
MKLAMVARVRHAWPAVALWGWLVATSGATAKAHTVQPPTAQAPAPSGPSDVSELARSWDHVNFEIPNPNAQITAAEALASQAQAMARSHPGEPGPLIWEAAALLAKADARHDLASLGLAKQARRLLEQAIADGASGEEGAFAHAVLGELYGATPGFPLGFGDRNKARAEFAKALALAPDDIDVNVLYADFLLDQKDPQGALEAAQHALNAPPRPGREIDDKGRRQEAMSVIAKAGGRAPAASAPASKTPARGKPRPARLSPH